MRDICAITLCVCLAELFLLNAADCCALEGHFESGLDELESDTSCKADLGDD